MIKINASLESIKTRKNVTDDVVQVIVFSIWTSSDVIGKLNEFYRKPIELTIEELKK